MVIGNFGMLNQIQIMCTVRSAYRGFSGYMFFLGVCPKEGSRKAAIVINSQVYGLLLVYGKFLEDKPAAHISRTQCSMYRMTNQVVSNLPLTPKQKFCFSMWPMH